MEGNPYAPPQSEIVQAHGHPDAERIRMEHLKTEGTIKSASVLYMLGAILVGAVGVARFINIPDLLAGTFLLVAAFQGWTAVALHRLNPAARIPAIILACIGLLGFPLGTLINGWILASLASQRGATVLKDPYRDIVAATPWVKRKTSTAVIVLLVVLLGILGLVVYWGFVTSN